MNNFAEATTVHQNGNGVNGDNDPFTFETPPPQTQQHRFSAFDNQLFALSHPSSSPAQAKKALEAHLTETDRRIQETSKLGTTLVQQRVNLSNRLREVSTEDDEDSKISPELRQKLAELEKEYNEVGRQSAKAFLGPRSDTSGVEGSIAPFALDGKVIHHTRTCTSTMLRDLQNPTSPSKFSSQATDSPSKLNVPRKHRNQASNSDHIEFAAEITTSLLGQVRHLQAVLAERDDALKNANADKSRLEEESEGFAQRLKHLDDSEQRYKDENWNLETQLQDLHAQQREATAREQKLQQTLTAASSERATYERELDDLKQMHGKLSEDHASLRKYHESELAGFRRSVNLGENEKTSMQRKIDELTSQNQQLAKGLAGRFKDDEAESDTDGGGQLEDFPPELSEREHSPPPSPTKGNPRHSMLESETLKSSLHHAHRMIQSLKSNVNREKSEKQDLKRMLQEARDELEIRRVEPNEKRLKSRSQTDMKKTARPGLGAARNSRTDVLIDDLSQDPEWEDHDGSTPQRQFEHGLPEARGGTSSTRETDASDAYQTANDTDDAFETANERDTTDNDAFQTGAESMAGESSEELTETEAAVNRGGTVRGKKATSMISNKPRDRRSIQSTASTSEEEGQGVHTPMHGQPQRFRLKLNRRSRGASAGLGGSVPSTTQNSPASFDTAGGEANQSLFAELENVSGDEAEGTPSRGSIHTPRSTRSLSRDISGKRSSGSLRKSVGSQPSTPSLRPHTMVYSNNVPPVPRIPTVDSGMMTDAWDTDPDAPSNGMYSSTSAITNRIFGGSPSTLQSRPATSQAGSRLVSDSTTTSTPPRPVWDQPLNMFSGIIPGFNQSANTTPMSTKTDGSQSRSVGDEPTTDGGRTPPLAGNLIQKPTPPQRQELLPPTLSLSPIQALETSPIEPTRSLTAAEPFDTPTRKSTDTTSGGILGSVFGWNRRPRAVSTTQTADESSQKAYSATQITTAGDNVLPQNDSANNATRDIPAAPAPSQEREQRRQSIYQADQGSQTVLSSEQIDRLFSKKDTPRLPDNQGMPVTAAMKPLSEIGAVSMPPPTRGFQDDTLKARIPEVRVPEGASFRDSIGKGYKRPTSAASTRSRSAQYPPLPPDHQEAIAAAAQKAPESMGPPLAPASAYPRSYRPRTVSRPRTPSQQGYPSPSSKGGTTPRAGRYSTTRSQVSRRSSVSSFASELDERFNIRTDGMPMPQGMSPNTDPRMIQAITQTMIGEMMWKYTRKAGRGEMSSSRHRRFFWVHPYTRTLYWSDRDPASANRAELKSKSVAIEAVRVVTDDNPMPPGLHRKSLIIVTPGRSVKFTAQTSQRHETWFNALSYLLLRTAPDGHTNHNAGGDLTDADIEEFNPGYNRRASRSRVSLASFKSQNAANRDLRSSLNTRAGQPNTYQSTVWQPPPESEDDRPERKANSIRNRISRSLSRSH
ncbi:MAG: hypothetical protein Q9164_006312, partial [Protoblastenia rupestris]